MSILGCFALTPWLVSGCAAPQVVYRDRLVRIPVPDPLPLDPALSADCPPSVTLPLSGPVTVGDMIARLGSVEDALLTCREELAQIRAVQPVLPARD